MITKIDSKLTAKLKSYALNDLNADLVGVANIARFANAPLRMSPQGILPSARSVVVMAIHHTDAAIEMGGLTHPQEIGPYSLQYHMNSRLDEMSYRLAMWLEGQGFAAVGIVSSNIWRYKGYKDLDAHFSPDVSHMHSAVAAGLAEFGFNGLAITPEYGARQRYVTVITDAEFTPSELLEPGSVCDNCMLCAKHCMSEALVKELDGFNEVPIEDKVYRYANKNLWRCAWGEHFDLDLDLPKPDHIDEAVIVEQVKQHGLRGGEMGSCLRYCVPRPLRYFDRDYTNAPRRRRMTANHEFPMDRGLFEKLRAIANHWGLDACFTMDAAALGKAGINPTEYLPDACAALCFVLKSVVDGSSNAGFESASDQSYVDAKVLWAQHYRLGQAAYDATRLLQESGYAAMCETGIDESTIAAQIENTDSVSGEILLTHTVLCSGEFPATEMRISTPTEQQPGAEELREKLADIFHGNLGGVFGVASADVLDEVARQLSAIYDGREYFVAKDRTIRFHAPDMEVHKATINIRSPRDRMDSAKTVIVLGVPLSASSVDIAARTPAEAIGPHTFTSYETLNRLCDVAGRLAGELRASGYKTVITTDLCASGSMTASPRGLLPDMFCNRMAAVAAGLGSLGKGGFVVSPEYGANLRFIAIVTDADIPVDTPLSDPVLTGLCGDCSSCVTACQTNAHGNTVRLQIGDAVHEYLDIDRVRCDWAKRYSLIADAGCCYTGWDLDIPAPADIDATVLRDALNHVDPVRKYRPCNFELCMMACPYVRKQDGNR